MAEITTPSGRKYEVLDEVPPRSTSSTSRTRTTTSKKTSTPEEPPKRTGRARPITVKGISASERSECKMLFTILLAGGDWTAWELSQAHVPVEGWWNEKDRLRQDESKLLVDAVYAEFAKHPEWLRRMLGLAKQSAHLGIIGALAFIAIPRLANHGLIPTEVAGPIALYGYSIAVTTNGQTTVPVESRGAHDGGSGDGDGEVHANGVDTPPAKVQDSVPKQTGRSRVAPTKDGTNGSVPY